jgi:hypothetical protein
MIDQRTIRPISDNFIIALSQLFPLKNVINDFEYALSLPEKVQKLPVKYGWTHREMNNSESSLIFGCQS